MKQLLFISVLLAAFTAGAQQVHKVLLLVRDHESPQLEYMLVHEVGTMGEMLRQSGFDVVTATTSGNAIETDSTGPMPNVKLGDVNVDEYYGFMLPCMTDASIPQEYVTIVRNAASKGKPVAAQYGAVHVLGEAGVLDGKKFAYAQGPDDSASIYPRFKKGIFIGRGVVQDGLIITSGTCPWMSKLHGYKDGTRELTQDLIEVMQEKNK